MPRTLTDADRRKAIEARRQKAADRLKEAAKRMERVWALVQRDIDRQRQEEFEKRRRG